MPKKKKEDRKIVAKIDALGFLWMDRANGLKQMECPFGAQVEAICGDWCPHFGEPRQEYEILGEKGDKRGPVIGQSLTLCHGTALLFDEIKDDR